MDGFALARYAAEHWPHISIVVASGHAKPGPGDLLESAHFIGKPFSARIVRDHLKSILPEDRKPEPLRGRSRPDPWPHAAEKAACKPWHDNALPLRRGASGEVVLVVEAAAAVPEPTPWTGSGRDRGIPAGSGGRPRCRK